MIKLEQDSQLRQRLLNAMIRLGSQNLTNKGVSTKTIAKECGVSEFMVFSYFGSKDGLVSEALRYCWQRIAKASLSKDPDSETMAELLNRLLDFALDRPDIMGFIVNYCPGFSCAINDNDALKKMMADLLEQGVEILRNFDLGENAKAIWFSLVREAIYDAQLVNCGLVSDTPEYRADCTAIFTSGLTAFLSKKEAA